MEHEDNVNVSVISFLEGAISNLKSFRKIKEQYDRQIAFNFNSIDFFKVNENIISDILAFFLNPESSHGQTDVFLKEFLNVYDLSFLENFKRVIVRKEDYTEENRRIDITIDFPDANYIIGIENKIYDETQDQPEQIFAYCRELENRYGKDNFKILYLTPSGHKPSNDSFNEDAENTYSPNLVLLSYKNNTEKAISLLDLLGKFELLSQADNVRNFIRDLKRYLEKKYFGGMTMDEKESTAKYVVENPDRIEIAWNVCQSMDIVKKNLWQNAKLDILKFAEQKNLKAVLPPNYNDLNIKYATLKFTPSGWKKACIVFKFEDRDLCNFWYGLEWGNECELLDFFMDLKQEASFIDSFTQSPNYANISNYSEDAALLNWNSSVKVWKMMNEKTEDANCLKITQYINEKVSYILKKIELLRTGKWKSIEL